MAHLTGRGDAARLGTAAGGPGSPGDRRDHRRPAEPQSMERRGRARHRGRRGRHRPPRSRRQGLGSPRPHPSRRCPPRPPPRVQRRRLQQPGRRRGLGPEGAGRRIRRGQGQSARGAAVGDGRAGPGQQHIGGRRHPQGGRSRVRHHARHPRQPASRAVDRVRPPRRPVPPSLSRGTLQGRIARSPPRRLAQQPGAESPRGRRSSTCPGSSLSSGRGPSPSCSPTSDTASAWAATWRSPAGRNSSRS